MAKKSNKRQTWNSLDEALVGLYGYNLKKPEASKPQFGSSFRPVLTVEGETKLNEPTPYNVAVHLGYMDWMEPIVKRLTQVKLPADQFKRLTDMCRKGSRDLLEPQLVRLRKALRFSPQPCYLYCVSEITQETDRVTGKPFRAEGPRVLCLLPKTPQVAQYYGLSESEIALLAPQVMWLVTILLPGQHAICTPAQLNDAIDGWPAYLYPAVLEQVQESVKQSHPQLISPSLTQLLLPEA